MAGAHRNQPKTTPVAGQAPSFAWDWAVCRGLRPCPIPKTNPCRPEKQEKNGEEGKEKGQEGLVEPVWEDLGLPQKERSGSDEERRAHAP